MKENRNVGISGDLMHCSFKFVLFPNSCSKNYFDIKMKNIYKILYTDIGLIKSSDEFGVQIQKLFKKNNINNNNNNKKKPTCVDDINNNNT